MLELAELREHVGPGPSDDVLERFLTAAFQSIEAKYGPAEDEISERLSPTGSLVRLSRRALSVSAVSEDSVLLDEEDTYVLWSGGRYLRRLSDGVAAAWQGYVDVTYEPFPEDAERERVAIALVNLDLNYAPGMTGTTIGPWSEQYPQGDRTYEQERQAILRSMRQPTVGVW
jgi:hypothetical protein